MTCIFCHYSYVNPSRISVLMLQVFPEPVPPVNNI